MMIKFFDTEVPIDEADIQELEGRLNFSFPSEYHDHLLKFNGGRCKPNVFSFREDGHLTASSVDWFLALYDGEHDNLENYFIIYKVEDKRMPETFYPIAHDPGGNLVCMNAEDGGIYFWDHEREVDYSQSDDRDWTNLYFIAASLHDFISKITGDEDE